jgi:hypothetical protein
MNADTETTDNGFRLLSGLIFIPILFRVNPRLSAA